VFIQIAGFAVITECNENKYCLHLHPTWRWRQQFTTKGGNRASQCDVTKTRRTFRLRRCEPACTSSEPAQTTSSLTRLLIMKTLIHCHILR
jgi:hypothetical protein